MSRNGLETQKTPGNMCREGMKFPGFPEILMVLSPLLVHFTEHWSHFQYLVTYFMDLQINALNPLTHLSGGPWNVSIHARNGTNALENVPAVRAEPSIFHDKQGNFSPFLHMFPGDFLGFQDNSCSPTPQGSMDNCPFVLRYNIVGAIALWFHKFYSHSHACCPLLNLPINIALWV